MMNIKRSIIAGEVQAVMPPPAVSGHVHNLAVQIGIQFMADHLGENVTVDDIAKVMRYSKFHASRMFEKVTGLTPGRYLSIMRFQHAAKIFLEYPAARVTDVANMVGFSSVGTFSTRFTEFFGVIPTQYRISRCRCGAFDSASAVTDKDHSYTGYCRAKDGDLCVRCHTCLAKRVSDGTPLLRTLLAMEKRG